MIGSSGSCSVLAGRSAYLNSGLGCKREKDVVGVGQYVRRVLRFVVRLLPFVDYRLSTLSFFAQGFAGIQSRAVSRLGIARFGEGRNCQVPRVRNGVLDR